MYRGSLSTHLRRTDQRNARSWVDFNFDVCLPDANATFLVLVSVFCLQLERSWRVCRRKQKVESIYRSTSQCIEKKTKKCQRCQNSVPSLSMSSSKKVEASSYVYLPCFVDGLCLLEPLELLEEKMKEWQLLPACVSPWCQCCLASLPSLGPLSQLESWRNRIGGSSAFKAPTGYQCTEEKFKEWQQQHG